MSERQKDKHSLLWQTNFECFQTDSGNEIKWVEGWNYLGVSLRSGNTFGCSGSERIQKFYRCANATVNIDGYLDKIVKLQLVESHSLPLLTLQ